MGKTFASTFVLLLLALTCSQASSPCPIPLVPGTRWVYQGEVKWTPGSTGVRQAKVEWQTEVLNYYSNSVAQVAILRGSPEDLINCEVDKVKIGSVYALLVYGHTVFRFGADDVTAAGELAKQLLADPAAHLDEECAMLKFPLAEGLQWAHDPARKDTWYGWCIETARRTRVKFRGGPRGRQPTYLVAYRTCPEHLLMEVLPGVGIIRFEYEHHGTVGSVDVRLKKFIPGPPPTKTLAAP